MNEKILINQTHYFEIRINGHLSDQRKRNFEGYQVSRLDNGKTLISGEIKDQAQLFGILIRIRDMGIPLMSFNIIQPNHNQTEGDSK